MKNMKKILCLLLAVAMVALVSVGLTIAYLTDRDSKANVFTIGNVDIVLNESFEQGTVLIPGVDIEKVPTITNTGKNDAWVWAHVAIPTALDSEYAYNNVVHFNYAKESVGDGKWNWKTEDGSAWNMSTATIDGMAYNVYTVMYQKPLEVGATTESILTKVYMDHNVDITPEGDMYVVENGITTPVDWNVKEEAFPIIYVSAYAVQIEGFDTAWDAHDAYFAQWGDNGIIWAEPGIPVHNEAELLKAFEVGGPYILEEDITLTGLETPITADLTLNLNGHTITADRVYPPATSGQSVSVLDVYGANVTIKGEGKIINSGNNAAYALTVRDGANVVIDGPTLVSYHDAVYVQSGTLTVMSGLLQATEDTDGSINDGPNKQYDGCHRSTVINCSDGEYIAGEAVVIVKGGTFVNMDPSNVHEGKMHNQSFVADGYTVVAETQSNGDIWYTVIPE
ncbi:MAG: hypothetical protein E7436_00955 [Ruminococcaceae bacterium]|nr:hypothetical protein [Oscillospiraceae bacterium]